MEPARARLAISLVDLTDLTDECDAAAIEQLCGRAVKHRTAAVCVWPDFVEQASTALAGSGIEIATVVNFPTGTERPYAVDLATTDALAHGATEIDVVLPFAAFASGDLDRCSAVLEAVRVRAEAARMKVILETGELGELDLVAAAARFAIDHGADFVKTSTGKSPVSATPEAARTMLDAIAEADRPVGIKPSGGIRTAADASHYLDLAESVMGEGWPTPNTFRFGASGVLDALAAVVAGDEPMESTASY